MMTAAIQMACASSLMLSGMPLWAGLCVLGAVISLAADRLADDE